MSESIPRYVDVHAAVVAHLESSTGVRTSSKTPADLTTPAVVVLPVVGSDDGVTDFATIDVQTFAPTRSVSWDLAERVRTAMFKLSGERGVDSVSTITRPTPVSYGNPDVVRFLATYRVTARAVEAP